METCQKVSEHAFYPQGLVVHNPGLARLWSFDNLRSKLCRKLDKQTLANIDSTWWRYTLNVVLIFSWSRTGCISHPYLFALSLSPYHLSPVTIVYVLKAGHQFHDGLYPHNSCNHLFPCKLCRRHFWWDPSSCHKMGTKSLATPRRTILPFNCRFSSEEYAGTFWSHSIHRQIMTPFNQLFQPYRSEVYPERLAMVWHNLY